MSKSRVYKGTVYVCAHRVPFYYRLPPRIHIRAETLNRMTEEAEDRAKSQITEGYVSGELNYETEELQATGWWRIEK